MAAKLEAELAERKKAEENRAATAQNPQDPA
jgi:hypothetical protein